MSLILGLPLRILQHKRLDRLHRRMRVIVSHEFLLRSEEPSLVLSRYPEYFLTTSSTLRLSLPVTDYPTRSFVRTFPSTAVCPLVKLVMLIPTDGTPLLSW